MDVTRASALVTGGASGLGAATARGLAARGAHVVVLDLNDDLGTVFAEEIGGTFALGDVTDPVAVGAALDAAESVSPLRALVHCAGKGGTVRLVDRDGNPGSLETFESLIRINLVGTFNVLRLAAARMARNEVLGEERGVCVLTASVAAYEGQVGQIPYASAKAGVVGMTLVAARDLASRLIRVSTIAPGAFDTPILARFSPEIRDALGAQTPHPSRLGRPDEFASLALQIIENPMLNGETIRLDGAIRMAPAMSELLVEERGRVLVLTMDRPHARNAMTLAMAQGIAETMVELDRRTDLSVAVITGAGGTFCAGMDLKGFARGEIPVVSGRGFAGLVRRPPDKPLIAAVEGYALAGGFEIVLACDLVVASDQATFGLPEVRRGLTAAAGGLLRLQHRIPYHLAMELVLTGRMWPATDAAAVRLVNRLTPAGSALDAALALAEEVAGNAPLALTASKRVLVESVDWPVTDKFDRQEAVVDPVRRSRDAREGAAAFVEKRLPVWTGS